MPTPNYPVNTPVQVAERQRALMEAQGYYAETFPGGGVGSTIMVSGQVYYCAIGLAAGDIVTNILTRVATAGATFSGIGMKLGLYSKAGVLLASTGDVSAAHSTAGAKTNPLILQSNGNPYVVPATDGYYVAALAIATTMPTLNRGGTGALYSAFGSSMGLAGNQVGQTDLPSTATITFNTGMIQFWFGIS